MFLFDVHAGQFMAAQLCVAEVYVVCPFLCGAQFSHWFLKCTLFKCNEPHA